MQSYEEFLEEHRGLAHPKALEAAEKDFYIRFEPAFPCYHCGKPATMAVLWRFKLLPKCKECVEKGYSKYAREDENA